jgi:hypothetical protein
MENLRHTRAYDELPAGAGRAAETTLDPAPLLGEWTSTNEATRGIVKLVVDSRAGALSVRVFGACAPSPCDWGETEGQAFSLGVTSGEAAAFKAFYDFGFMETFLAAYLNKRILVVDAYNIFKDGSGRAQYFLRDHFYQKGGAPS